jgi:uncharacterized protein (DUF1697 family)
MPTHVALLRAVNLGGHGKVAMSDLRSIVSDAGFDDVSTYVNSGNALFTTSRTDCDAMAAELSAAILDRLGSTIGVVVLSADDLDEVIAANPFPEESNPKALHAVVLSAPLRSDVADRVAELVASDTAGDSAQLAGRVLYINTPSGIGRSDLANKLTRLLAPAKSGVTGTGRNWTTITTLRDRLNG